MRLQAKLKFSVPTAILASETLKTAALQDFEGHAWTDYPSRRRPYHTHMGYTVPRKSQGDPCRASNSRYHHNRSLRFRST